MQSANRCPRCGYVLTYNGYSYYCSFCGYPQTKETLAGTLHSLEKNVSTGIQRFFQALKPKLPPQAAYYPVNLIMQPCASCGFNFPKGAQTCPSCGVRRPTESQIAPTPKAPETYDLDRRVFDYINIHGGTISLSQTAEDLAINQEALLSAIDRLKAGGFLSES